MNTLGGKGDHHNINHHRKTEQLPFAIQDQSTTTTTDDD
jgi:hypothetical protein